MTQLRRLDWICDCCGAAVPADADRMPGLGSAPAGWGQLRMLLRNDSGRERMTYPDYDLCPACVERVRSGIGTIGLFEAEPPAAGIDDEPPAKKGGRARPST